MNEWIWGCFNSYLSEMVCGIPYDSKYPQFGAPERSDWNDFISFLHLETRPETRLGFPRRPVLSVQSAVGVIRHPTGLHVGVTPYALDRAFHIHLQRKA
jgi:hypothetical protein